MAFRTALGAHFTEMTVNFRTFMRNLPGYSEMALSERIETLSKSYSSVFLAETCLYPEGVLHYGMDSENYLRLSVHLPEFDCVIRPTGNVVWQAFQRANLNLVEQGLILTYLIYDGMYNFVCSFCDCFFSQFFPFCFR